MDLLIDVRWLLERQADLLPRQPSVHDFSALSAAVGRHRVKITQLGATVDNAWRAAALMHSIIRLRPLPARNALFGAAVAIAYMHAAEERLEAPYGQLVILARDLDAGRADAYEAAAKLRSWRI
ncbi:toxin Doc [Streptomyces sp. NPDC090022]|uniref:toxin Doc n=1 Tax=Streptomyces sp. NPDC090022 TaxID=3365920 RepID=UPI00381B588A